MSSSDASSEDRDARWKCFRTTHWSLIVAAGKGSEATSRRALEALCATYWPPAFTFLRRHGCTVEDAEDLTQGFFARLLEKGVVAQADPTRGRFRNFLLASLKNYVANEKARDRAERRGGSRKSVDISLEAAERVYRTEFSTSLSPERVFIRHWALTLLERALTRLKTAYAERGSGEELERLLVFLTGNADGYSYASVARELGMSEGAVKMAVHRMRKRYGDCIRDEIEGTVADVSEIDDEIEFLFAALE